MDWESGLPSRSGLSGPLSGPTWITQWVYLGHVVDLPGSHGGSIWVVWWGYLGCAVGPLLASGRGSILIPTVELTVDGSLRPHRDQRLLLPEQLSL